MGRIRRIAAAVTVIVSLLAVSLIGTGQPAAAAAALYSRLVNGQSGYCMDDYARTGLAYHYPCNRQWNQLWTWRKANPSTGDNRWLIINRESGFCLHQTGYDYYKEVRLRACSGTGDADQWWRWERSSRYAGYWFLKSWYPRDLPDDSDNSPLCVATSNSDVASKLILGACGEWPAHLWYQEPPSG